MRNKRDFPEDFVWGAATASFQIEGGAEAEGRGESVWDAFCRQPGKVRGLDDGREACDHYHRWREDIGLMRELGLKGYRFSVAWPRVIPGGVGAVNAAGLDFYERLVDGLLAAGIEPFPTLYHWDLPQVLEDRGGWPARETVEAFAAYAEAVVKRLGDRVGRWMTLNEIPIFVSHGYGNGLHAPGRKLERRALNQAYHHALLAHGRAVAAVRAHARPGAQVGLVNCPLVTLPVAETPEHVAAARAAFHRYNAYLLDPLHRGAHAPWWLAEQGADAPEIRDGDLAAIAAPCDFHGLNLYSGVFVEAAAEGEPGARPGGWRELPFTGRYPRLSMPWLKPTPQLVYWACRLMREDYGAREFYVTECGAAAEGERPDPDFQGRVVDLERREFLRTYLLEARRAVAEGYGLKGWFVWSLLDNFEWAEGYAKRFGLVHVDYRTQRRTPKESYRWYREVIRAGKVL